MPVGVSGDSQIDIDTDSIEHEETRVRAWFQENTKAYRSNPIGREYRSVVTLEVFDCAKRTAALEKAVYYSASDTTGRAVGGFSVTVADTDFASVVPRSIGELKLKRACSSQAPSEEEKK